MNYQTLSPRDFDEINDGTISLERVQETVAYATK